MATTISTLAAKLILDNGKFIQGFKQSGQAAKGFNADLKVGAAVVSQAIGIAGAAVAALAAEAAIAATVVATLYNRMVDLDKQAKTARKLGLGFSEIQKLGIAARASGTDLDVLTKAMLHMGRTIGSGRHDDMAARFLQVADNIAAIEDPALRSAQAVKIFGKGGDDLLTLLIGGSAGIRRSAAAIERFGLALDDMDAKKIEAANDAIGVLTEVWTAFLNKAAVEVAPTFEKVANVILDAAEKLGKSFKSLGTDISIIGDIFTAVGGVAVTVLAEIQLVVDGLVVMAKVVGVIGTVVQKLHDGSITNLEEVRKALDEVNNANKQFKADALELFSGGPMQKFFKDIAEAREGAAKSLMGGAGGLLGGGAIGKAIHPAPLEKNSVDAVRAIQKAGGDGISGVNASLRRALQYLKNIDSHLDPTKAINPDSLVLREGAI